MLTFTEVTIRMMTPEDDMRYLSQCSEESGGQLSPAIQERCREAVRQAVHPRWAVAMLALASGFGVGIWVVAGWLMWEGVRSVMSW